MGLREKREKRLEAVSHGGIYGVGVQSNKEDLPDLSEGANVSGKRVRWAEVKHWGETENEKRRLDSKKYNLSKEVHSSISRTT